MRALSESCEGNLWLSKLPFISVQCDLSFGASLQKLSDVVDVLGCVTR